MKDRIVTALMSSVLALVLLWMTFAASTVSRTTMVEYVEVTALEHMRLLREDFKSVRTALSDVSQRLAGVEAILRERLEDEK